MMRQVVLDTETTGLLTSEGHRIIEIGVIEIINRQVTGNTYHQYIRPQRDIDPGAQAVHGITKEFLADKPIFAEIFSTFFDFIKDAELIIHNAPFDVGFINYEFQLLKNDYKPVEQYCTIFDTLTFARKKHPGQQNSLDALCRRYEVDNSGRNFHGALLDANLLAEVYLAMTGGQTSLFVDMKPAEEATHVSTVNTQLAPTFTKGLKVITADANEQKAHQEKLDKIKQASGACLWLNES